MRRLLCLAFALCAVRVMRASADDPPRVVLRIASEADRALAPRLRGQLSDLETQLIVTDIAPLEANLEQQLLAARAIATMQQADVVVWCASELGEAGAAPQRRIFIALVRSDRVVSRPLLAARSGALSSSDLETAALLVRGALVALAQHVDVGVAADAVASSGSEARASKDAEPTDEVLGAPPISPAQRQQEDLALAAHPRGDSQPMAASLPAEAPTETRVTEPAAGASAVEAQPHDRAEPPREGPAKRSDAVIRARLTVGAQLALDGISSSGQRGLSARAAVDFGAWTLGAYGVLSLASHVDDPYFSLSVARHALGLALERTLFSSRTLALGVGLHAGALLLRRVSRASNPSAISLPPSLTAAFALGPEIALRWLPARFGISLRFGIDILPSAPRFELAGVNPQHAASSHSLWMFEPRTMLAWETALP